MSVNDDQLFQIQGYLIGEGVSDVGLQEDLVDDYCCIIEDLMGQGKAFDVAFEADKMSVAPEGPGVVQEDLNYLVTIKKKVMLRKLVFVFGFFGMLDLMLALAFRVSGFLDTEVAGLLAMAGILILSVSILPFWFFQLYKKSIQQVQQA